MREYVIDAIALLALAQSLARTSLHTSKSSALAAVFSEVHAAS
jgi:hypothetical protein